MSSTRVAKRKAEDGVPEVSQEDPKKRAKKDEGSDHERDEAAAAERSDSEGDVDDGELEALDTSNVLPEGRRTRGVRVDYTKLNVDVNDEDDEEDEEEEEEEEHGEVEGDEKLAGVGGVTDEAADKTEEEGDREEEEEVVANGTTKEKNGAEDEDEE